MSLQIWLPLDGYLENKGCADAVLVNNGATVADGKIGKCYSFDGNDDYISISSAKLNSIIKGGTYPFSIAMWIYHADETRAILFGDYSTSGAIQFNVELTTGHHFRFYWNGAPDLYFNDTVYDSKWSHCVLTYDGANLRVYQDGVLNETKPYVLLEKNKTSGFYMLGRDNRTGTTALNGMLNDVRVYDHCLSQAEVNEIAQGLVLHYKLSPYLNWLNPVGEKYITRGSGNNFTDYAYDSRLLTCTDTAYIVDFDAKGTADDMYIDIYFRDSGGASYAITSKELLTTNWKHYSLAINGSPENLVLFRVRLWSGTVGDIAYFKNMKLTSQNMPYNETKVVDSSGYGRHGDVVGTAQFSTDTARYSNSYVMDGVVANRIEYNKTTFNYTDNFSWAMWVKENHTGDAAQYVFTSGRADAGGYGFGLQNSDDTGLNCRFGNKSYRINVTKNEWTHIAYTKSGTTQKLYKNGELYSTQTFDGTLPTYSDGKGLGLGCFHYTGNIYPAYGNISDFRIYCTALSADAIRDLYKTQLKIDNSGRLHSFEMMQDDGVKINSKGVLIDGEFIEYGHNFYEGGNVTYKPTNNGYNSTAPYNGIVDLSSVANMGLPLSIKIEFDFTWSNFSFLDVSGTLIQEQGDSRKKEDGTFTWTNGLVGVTYLTSYITSSSGTVHVSTIKEIAADRLELLDGFRIGLRCDYSDGNGTLTLSNIKVTVASTNAKMTNKYISGNGFTER